MPGSADRVALCLFDFAVFEQQILAPDVLDHDLAGHSRVSLRLLVGIVEIDNGEILKCRDAQILAVVVKEAIGGRSRARA